MNRKKICIYLLAVGLLVLPGCKKQGEETKSPDQPVPISLGLPQALFTEPQKVLAGSASTVIMDQLIALVNATPKGESIYISIYCFDYPALVTALKAADTRGVQLHLLVDRSIDESAGVNAKTIAELKKFSLNTEVVEVDNDAGSIAIDHNKFVLFSNVQTTSGLQSNLVLQTSHNFTAADTRKLQDAVLLSDKGLYDAYLEYWTDMKSRATSGMKYYSYKEYSDAAAGLYAFFLPKRKNGTAYGDDTIIELLNSLSDLPSDTIKVGMSDWTDSRKNIADTLLSLQAKGARIEVIAKSSIDTGVLNRLEQLRTRGAYVKVLNMTDAAQQKMNIHSKFLLLSGTWKGKAGSHVLVTGSHNFTQNALRNNNETILLFENHVLFSDYERNFQIIQSLLR